MEAGSGRLGTGREAGAGAGGRRGGRREAGDLFKGPACREHPQARVPALGWGQWAARALSPASPNSDRTQIA